MRKLRKCIVVLLAMLPFMACESADNKIVEFSDLPSTAQKFVKAYFPDKTIALVLCDESLFDKDYEVRFEDGSEVEFDKTDEGASGSVLQYAGGTIRRWFGGRVRQRWRLEERRDEGRTGCAGRYCSCDNHDLHQNKAQQQLRSRDKEGTQGVRGGVE